MKIEQQYIDISLEESQNKENYLTNELLKGTPLWLIKTNEDGTEWILSYGRYCLKKGKSKEELKNYLEDNMLNVITDIIIATIEESKIIDNINEEDNQQLTNQ